MLTEKQLENLKLLPDIEKRIKLNKGKPSPFSTKIRLSRTQRKHTGEQVGMGGNQ